MLYITNPFPIWSVAVLDAGDVGAWLIVEFTEYAGKHC